MKLAEVTELLNDVFRCSLKESNNINMFLSIPEAHVYDSETDGWKLCIKKTVVDDASLNCLKAIADKRKLKIGQSAEGYFSIYTPRKESRSALS